MAKKISSNDIFSEEDIFRGVRASAEETIKMMEALRKEVEGTAQDLKKSIGGAKFDSVKAIENVVKVQQKSNKLTKEAIQIDKLKSEADAKRMRAIQELEKIEQQKLNTESKAIRVAEQKAKQQERMNKQREKAIKQSKNEASAYKKLEKNTRDLKNQSKELGAEMLLLEQSGKKNTAQYQKLSKQYRKVTASAKAGDKQLKKLDKTVGDNFRSVGNYKSALAGLQRGLGQLGLAFGVAQIFRTGSEAIIGFQQSVQDLSAITGASGEDLKFFKEQARELGIEVEGGATAVVEAYKLIGSAKPELLENARALNEVTKSAVLLSQASGLELPDASIRLTSALNQFKAPAEEAGRFINVLANGAKFGSKEIPAVTDALLKFGGVADTFNVSIEESVAMIELLGPSFKESAEVGTALRNIMIKMSAPEGTPKLAKAFAEAGINVEKMSDKSLSFEERVRTLLPLLEDENAMIKVFGTQNIIGAKAMLTQVDAMTDMTEKMHTLGTVQDQANKRTDTLGHAILKLKNTFVDLFIGLANNEGAMQGFTDSLKWLANNLPMIITILGKLIRTYVVYQATLKAIQVSTFLYNNVLKAGAYQISKNIKGTRAYRLEQIKLARATKDSKKQTTALAQSLKSMGLMAVIGLVTELAVRWYDVASGARNARMEAEQYAKAEERAQKKLNSEQKYWRDIEKEELLEIREREADGEITSQRARELEITTKKQIAQQFEQLAKEREKDIALVVRLSDEMANLQALGRKNGAGTILKRSLEVRGELNTALMTLAQTEGYIEGTAFVSNFLGDASEEEQLLAQSAGVISQFQKEIDGYVESQEDYNMQARELAINVKTGNKEFTKFEGTLSSTTKSYEDINKEFPKLNGYISKQTQLLQELKEIEQDRVLLAKDDAIELEYENQLRMIRETGEFDATHLNSLIEEKVALEKQYIDQRTQYEQSALDVKYKREKQARKDSLKAQYDALILGAGTNQKAIDEIDANYKIQQDLLANQEIERAKDVESQKQNIYQNGINDKLEAEQNGYDSMSGMLESFVQETADLGADATKKVFQSMAEFVKASADFFIQQSNRKIEQMNKEISQAEKNADLYRELAKNGNISAKESLAEQQDIINEANKRKLAEEKKQQRLRLMESVFNTYNSKVQADVENPLAETIRDVSLLYQFINTLPGFFDGTEDTGTNGKGVDGKGGFQAILHPNERVIPKSLNDKLTGLSNEELTQIAMDYKNGVVVAGAEQSASALELALVVNGLKEIKDEIRNKPETSIELGQITSSLMEVVKTSKKGNSVVYNRFKIRK